MMMLLDAWQTISSFLTPATLFLLLNLVIGTILLSSRYHRSHQPDPSGGTSFAGTYNFPILRTTSPVLDRLKSFTLHRFRSGDLPTDPLSTSPGAISNHNPVPTELGSNPTNGYSADFSEASAPPLARTSSILNRLKSINLYRFRSGEIQTEQVNTESIATTSTELHYERSNSEPSKPVVKKKKKKIASVGGTEMEVRQKTIGYSADFSEATTTNSAPPLARTSSILDRLKSINLYRFRSGEIQTEQVNTESVATTSTEPHYERSNSEPSKPVVKKKKMKKIASVGGTEMEVRQKTKTSFRGRDVVVEEEVDARADNFINNFREQLKIQRLNSILNYKEMLNRGR